MEPKTETEAEAKTSKRGRPRKTNGRKGNGTPGGERRKGAGTLEYRKRKGYIARWTIDGKRFSQMIGHVSKTDAEKRLAEIVAPFQVRDEIARAEMLQGKLDGARGRLRALEAARPALALADAVDAYETSPERPDTASEKRLALVRVRFGFFVAFMRDNFPDVVEMRQVTREHAQAFAGCPFMLTRSNSTRNDIISICKSIYKTLADHEAARLDGNPFEKIKRRHETPARRRELTTDELARVLSSVSGEMRVLFTIGIYTGLRLGDCALMKWDNVDLPRGLIMITPQKTKRKTGARVTIPIFPALYNLLSSVPIAARVGYVLPGVAETYQRNEAELVNAMRRAFEKCGIETSAPPIDGRRRVPLVGFHSLRHTFVSLCANAGVPLAIVQSIVGHARVEMTRHYFHENETALKAAIGALPDVTQKAAPSADASPVSARVRSLLPLLDALDERERADVLRYLQGEELTAARPALPAPAAVTIDA